MTCFVLVPGPLVRASSWEPTAHELRASGHDVQVPDVLAHVATVPSWNDWTNHLLQHIRPAAELILVGHSSASTLVADLSTKLPATAIIIVDGDVPPTHGPASPVRPALRAHIMTLADTSGRLPIWSTWFAGDRHRMRIVGIDRLASDAQVFARFEDELPTMTMSWFDDRIDLAAWEHVPAGYIQTSPIYDHALAEAARRGWPVTRLDGTHLHPMLEPHETAAAILSLARRFGLP